MCRVSLFLSMARCLTLRLFVFFSSRRRHTRFDCDWSSDVCSSDLVGMVRDVFRAELCPGAEAGGELAARPRLARDFARIGIVRIENEHAIFGQNAHQDRKSTRLNSSHSQISYAVF